MRSTVLKLLLFVVLLTSRAASAQTFSGPYAGVEFGRQHIIGGSLVNGVDTLQEDSRLVTSFFGGFRVEVKRFVVGGDAGIGLMDGDLSLNDPAQALSVDYRAGSQWHWALHAGYAVRPATLVFGYLSEVTRSFDVTVTQSGHATPQEDEQGMLRFGGGVEQRLRGPLHLRVTAGTSRADFGGQPTNIDVNRRFEFGAGLVLQF